MAMSSFQQPVNYDPRWFIWTIVFLLVTGISLVSYILLSDNTAADASAAYIPAAHHATVNRAAP